ncbi:hypothetical protein [Sulfitobacter mediterraneus]|uniref:Uncharacterized protein n=1 Tax=Sulfitobacter mediterraneus TaxID=83219 RepID=A0A061SQG1_9RHOB|nr:hypothetical protein [Sulfitobacter mediterraneus]KAJ01649.1 hypothetical protein PM02_18210 [Sulfitobacter mediterraneus]
MAEILSFKAKTASGQNTTSTEEFLQEGNETLSFQVTEGGSVGLANIIDHQQKDTFSITNDWTNQELADLYRVKRLLDAAGVPNNLDRGLTDEGDPWLVFVGPDGEVFIHLCRLDALYILDSPNIPTPLRGADFNELIQAFTNRALPHTGQQADGTDTRLIRLERGGKVYLHPSALLAALIWTLFLSAEDLVLLAPDEDQTVRGLQDIEALSVHSSNQNPDSHPELASDDDTIKLNELQNAEAADHDPRHTAGHEAFLRDSATSGLTLTQNSYGMGLSTIAIAFGFMAEQAVRNEKHVVSDEILTRELHDGSEGGLGSLVVADDAAPALPVAHADTIEIASGASGDERTPEDGTSGSSLNASDAVAETKAFSEGLQAPETKAVKVSLWVDTSYDEDLPKEVDTTAGTSPSEQHEAASIDTSTAEALPALMTLSTLKTTLQPTGLQSYALGDTVVQASFDLNSTALKTFAFLDDPTGQNLTVDSLIDLSISSAPEFRNFDDSARAFMDFILDKSDSVEMISSETELILIDSSAFEQGHTYVLSWMLDDGGIISMIGLRSEFQDFDLIA